MMPIVDAVLLAILCLATGVLLGFDTRDLQYLRRLLTGETHAETMRKVRAALAEIRKEYTLRPHDRFAMDMLEICDRMEQTCDRAESKLVGQ